MSSPKRTASPAPSSSEAKRIRLTVNQGVTPVDPENAAGKRSELEPIQGGDIGNLPPAHVGSSSEPASAVPARLLKADGDGEGVDDSGDVSMAEGADAADEEVESADENDDEDPAQLEATRLRLEEQARKYLAAQTHEVIIPSYAAWFDMSKIHPIERRALPEFFNSRHRSKTPAIYKDYRDFMINTYRLRPSEYLTVTACRRNLAGDVCAIMRVHAFLEQWGLINYQIDPDQRPAALAPPFTGHFRVILDTPRGLQSLHPGTRPKDPNAQAAVNGATKPSPTPASLELRNSIYQTSAKSSRPVSSTEAASLANGANGISGDNPTTIKYQCDTCGVDCTSVRYHSLKQKNFELCPPCYLDGRFPSHMYSGDFVKLTSTTSANGVHQAAGAAADDDWTDQEILLLLEGVEMYDDDWSAIEEHVGTRSAQQCIRKFLQLPIEDPYVSAEGDLGPLRYARVPFEQADNPVMSVVAFLAGVISPGVAAEAAKTALHQLTDGDTKVAPEEDQKEGIKADSTPEEGEKKDEEKMEEDKPKEEGAEKSGEVAQSTDGQTAQDDMQVDAQTGGESQAQRAAKAIPHSKVVRAADLALKSASKAAGALADAEDLQIRSTLASLIKLTLTKLELKTAQFEELEELLEDERKSLESARMALVNERVNLRRLLDNVKSELAKHGATPNPGLANAVAQAQTGLGVSGQGTKVNEVQGGAPADGDQGPVSGGNIAQLS
ncbi:Smarcc1 protein [Trametes versicolor FP-101664 SS1]|uniref:Smarcc1 protein n=1 Tax=Trametes versicolor (strain FP-101664) TaxID=717944 RepID=UPI0004621FAD|nr:Smarcc1 protein [Trametes versicolor FP-101664 SS1]EIW55293.1 Smarcc1 protein [Trametes versicolor FP-101664 SS1]